MKYLYLIPAHHLVGEIIYIKIIYGAVCTYQKNKLHIPGI